MRKIIAFIIIFIFPFVTVGCEKRSIEDNLKDLGYNYFCKNKTCYIYCFDRGDIGFTLEKDENNEYSFYFDYRVDNVHVSYFPKNDDYSVWDYDHHCDIKNIADYDCKQKILKYSSKINEVYERELHYLDITEKELYDYLVDLYNKNYIQ